MDTVFLRDLLEFVEDEAHDLAFFAERHEGGFEAVDDEAFDFVVGEVEDLAGELVFVGDGGIGHEAVVGVEGDAEAEIHVEFEGVIFDGVDSGGLDVGFEADFEGDAVIVDVVEEVAVFAQARAVSDAVGIAVVDGLVNGSWAVGFTGMNCRIEVILADEGEGFGVSVGRVIGFAAGEVESDNAFIFEGDGEFGEAQ